MDVVVWCLAGALIGLLATVAGSSHERPNAAVVNVVAGMVGAVATGWLLSGLFQSSTSADGLNLAALLVSSVGAGVALSLVEGVRSTFA